MVAALRCKHLGPGLHSFHIDGSGLVDPIFITDPREWQTRTLEAFKVASDGIACRETGTWTPLLESGVLCCGSKLTKDDMCRLLGLLDIQFSRNIGKDALLKILAMHIKDDAAFISEATCIRAERNVVELLAEDPLFGATFEDLDQNDQGEHGDINKSLQAVKHRRLGRDLQVKRRFENMRLETTRRRRVKPRGATSSIAAPSLPLLAPRTHVKQSWDNRGYFALAPVNSRHKETGELQCTAFSARCKVPGHKSCNKSVTLRSQWTLAEARLLIMQWCFDGLFAADREAHMSIVPPSQYCLAELGTEQEILEMANDVIENDCEFLELK